MGVSQVDSGRLHHCSPILNIGLGLIQSAGCVIVILLADCVVGKSLFETIGTRSNRRQTCLRPAKGGLSAVKRRLKLRRIDLVEHLSGLNVGTFHKQTFLYDAGDLGPNFSHEISGRSTG